MYKIIEKGIYKEDPKIFKCPWCSCKFETDKYKDFEDDDCYGEEVVVKCPSCEIENHHFIKLNNSHIRSTPKKVLKNKYDKRKQRKNQSMPK